MLKKYKYNLVLVALITNIMLLPNMASAVNSLAIAGPDNSVHYKTASISHDLLDNYYTSGNHLWQWKAHAEQELGYFIAFQPQILVEHAHGTNEGMTLHWGTRLYYEPTTSDEPVWAQNMWDNHFNGGKNGIAYSSAPFGVWVLASCTSMSDLSGMTFTQVFYHLRPWMIIGNVLSPTVSSDAIFATHFIREITEKKKSYLFALCQAALDADNLCNDDYSTRWWFQSQCKQLYNGNSNGIDHYTPYDVYRKINSKREYEGQLLYKGEEYSKTLTYDHRNFKGTSNGGYIVFHGIMNDDDDDLLNYGTIQIEISKDNGHGGKTVLKDVVYPSLTNHCIQLYPNDYDYYSGSDSCSIYVTHNEMDNLPNGKLYAKLVLTYGTASKIKIDRFEFMEIGK